MENIQNNIQQEDTIDIKKFIFKILYNWYWFAISAFITLSIAYFINRYTDPTYKVNASILIKDKNASGGIESIIQEIGFMSRRLMKKEVENEIGILSSYTLAKNTIEELDFGISYFSVGRIREPEAYKNTPFYVVLDTNKTNLANYKVDVTYDDKNVKIHINNTHNITKTLKFGEKFESEDFNFTIYKNENYNDTVNFYDYYFVINKLHDLANKYSGKLSLEASDKKSSIILLSTTGKVPQKEVDYLNKLLDVYIQKGLDEKNKTAINTVKFIDNQLLGIVDSLHIAEYNLEQFRLNNGAIIDISAEGREIYKKLEDYQREKYEYDQKLAYYNYLLDYVKSKNEFDDVIAPAVMGINDPLLNQLITELNKLYSERGN